MQEALRSRISPTPRVNSLPIFVSENDLQSRIDSELTRRGWLVRREFRLSYGKVDILAIKDDRHLVMEIKPAAVGRPVFDQIDRYYKSYLTMAADGAKVIPVVVARHFQTDFREYSAVHLPELEMIRYDVSADGALVFYDIATSGLSAIL